MSVKIEHRIGVQAPAEAIWAVICDIEAWPLWNPIYTKAKGQLRIGAALELELSLAGRKPQVLRPVILDWIPNEQIHWRLTALGGLVRTTRYLEIEILADNACIFANGELFEGPLGPLAIRSLERSVRAGFRAMGEAVKARAEAAWRPAQAATT